MEKNSGPPKRKKKIVISRSQIRITFLMLLVIAIFSVLCISSAVYFSRKNKLQNDNIITDLNDTIVKEDNMVTAFITFAKTVVSNRYELKTDKIFESHEENIESIKGSVEKIEEVNSQIILLVIILSAILMLCLHKKCRRLERGANNTAGIIAAWSNSCKRRRHAVCFRLPVV
jgi:hypothetical protein